MKTIRLLVALAALLVALAPAAAQETFLALPNTYPNIEGRALLLREPDRELIVISEAATPEDLVMALRLLEQIRNGKHQPPKDGTGHMFPIIGYAPAPELTPALREHIEATLAELRRQPLAMVGNLGPGRWMAYERTP